MISCRDRLILSLPLALVLLPFLVWPMAFGFFASFTNYSPFELHPHFAGLSNYKAVLEDSSFTGAFRTIGVIIIITVPVELSLGLAIAFLLRKPFRGREALRVILLIPWLISPVANGVMWHFLYSGGSGIINYFLGWLNVPSQPSPLGMRVLALPALMLSEIWRSTPLAIFLLFPGILSVPQVMWQQATLEGASPFQKLRHVALPWTRPLLLTVAMLLIGGALGTFDSVLMMTGGGPGSETLTPALYSFRKAFLINNWPAGATSAWFIAAGVLVAGAIYVGLSRREATE